MSAKRPSRNPQISLEEIKKLLRVFEEARTAIEKHAAHLNSLDVQRHNKVNIKRTGFIERAKSSAEVNPEFLPHWITAEKFSFDAEHFAAMRALLLIIDQIRKMAANIAVVSSDMAYTDALEYYAVVREAAKRGVDAAESVLKGLDEFFKSNGSWTQGMQTQKKIKKDMNALLKGKKDGIIKVENISPKEIKGEKIVIDKTFK